MTMAYTIARLDEGLGAYPLKGPFDPDKRIAPYDRLMEARIDQYPWGGDYRPDARAYVGYNEGGVHVLLCARERTIRAEVSQIGGQVCVDSCLEFFFNPFPFHCREYANVEVNPAGVFHIGLGAGRGNRRVLNELPLGWDYSLSAHENGWWAVSYTVPMDWIAQICRGNRPAPGDQWIGNFYSCDESIHPHFGCHFEITSDEPDFHRPEWFGRMILSEEVIV